MRTSNIYELSGERRPHPSHLPGRPFLIRVLHPIFSLSWVLHEGHSRLEAVDTPLEREDTKIIHKHLPLFLVAVRAADRLARDGRPNDELQKKKVGLVHHAVPTKLQGSHAPTSAWSENLAWSLAKILSVNPRTSAWKVGRLLPSE